MRNSDGTYTVTRYYPSTGVLLSGNGKTIEEARFALKNERKKYREGMMLGVYLVPTGEKVRSPGESMVETRSGTVRLTFDPNRMVDVKARPEIAHYVQKGRKDNIVKETRQIRRARERSRV